MISRIRAVSFAAFALVLCSSALAGGPPAVDEAPARPGEWGFRPRDGQASATDPPGFVWRPQRGAARYEIQVARDEGFGRDRYAADGLRLNCHCPSRTFGRGRWHWRFRFVDKGGQASAWSRTRTFTIPSESVDFPLPARRELLARIPKRHPRLFVRPEQISRLRKLADGPLRGQRAALVRECERLLNSPPPTAEPDKYPPGMARKSEAWRGLWWGNRRYTIRTLNGAATLAFTRLLTGRDDYGRLAKRLLLAAAEWDPKGATGYRYNDEAGMPYNYYFARAYTFVHDLLTDAERARCREVMTVRGREMYRHLCPGHIWRPYGSHRNRAWHFLGEVGIAFLDEIPDAADWAWFAVNVFRNVYPVWSDDDGGWHEGLNYWRGYLQRFAWWADVMRVATGVDAYRKPYFSKIGYYPMYLQPPGTRGGGFGDLNGRRRSADNRSLMTVLAAQGRNPHWQWYVDAHGGPRAEGGYVGFVRGALPSVPGHPPSDLPTGRCFRGTGQAVLNTSLSAARENVGVIFKSSPFGTQSHGYESNNSFLLYAFGRRLLIRTGRRDIYGSRHHQNWMWHTRSTNCITVDGIGQVKHSAAARGEILGFHTSGAFDYVAGEAAKAYPPAVLKRFTRHVLFVKPGLIVLYDRLEAPRPKRFEWWLHSPTEMKLRGQEEIRVASDPAAARVSILAPSELKLTLTNRFDPPPRPRVKLVEWHLAAQTKQPARRVEFVTLVRVHRTGETPPTGAKLAPVPNGYALRADIPGGHDLVLLRSRDAGRVAFAGQAAEADLAAVRFDAQGKPAAHLTVTGRTVWAGKGNLPG